MDNIMPREKMKFDLDNTNRLMGYIAAVMMASLYESALKNADTSKGKSGSTMQSKTALPKVLSFFIFVIELIGLYPSYLDMILGRYE